MNALILQNKAVECKLNKGRYLEADMSGRKVVIYMHQAMLVTNRYRMLSTTHIAPSVRLVTWNMCWLITSLLNPK